MGDSNRNGCAVLSNIRKYFCPLEGTECIRNEDFCSSEKARNEPEHNVGPSALMMTLPVPTESSNSTEDDCDSGMEINKYEGIKRGHPVPMAITPMTTESDIGASITTDLGFIIKPSMTTEEVCEVVSNLANTQKYHLLKENYMYKPSMDFDLPKAFSSGCNRCFHYIWIKKYPWLVYGKTLNGAFCKFCANFPKIDQTLVSL